jgi:hypothetical protein
VRGDQLASAALSNTRHPDGGTTASPPPSAPADKVRENDGGHLGFRFKNDVFCSGPFFVENGVFCLL